MSLSSFKRGIRKMVDQLLRKASRLTIWEFWIGERSRSLFAQRDMISDRHNVAGFIVSVRAFEKSIGFELSTALVNVGEQKLQMALAIPFFFHVRLEIELCGRLALKFKQFVGSPKTALYSIEINRTGLYLYDGYNPDVPESTPGEVKQLRWRNICGAPKHDVRVLEYRELDVQFPGSHQITAQTCQFKYVKFQNRTKWGWFPKWFDGNTYVELVTDNPPSVCRSTEPVLKQPAKIYYRLYSADTTFEQAVARYAEEILRLRQEQWELEHPGKSW